MVAAMNNGLLLKIAPNHDLVTSLEAACLKRGVRSAVILSGVGSLNDGWLLSPVPGVGWVERHVQGPGLEVAGLAGEVRIDEDGKGHSSLTAWVTSADGTVTGGVLMRDLNIVCVTFELLLQRWLRD